MTTSLVSTVVSSPRPLQLAHFYADLLGWAISSDDPDWVKVRDPANRRAGLSFQLEPLDSPPAWPATQGKTVMQAHLDFVVDDLDQEVARATRLGAVAEEHQPEAGVAVMRDPHGHLFCLFLPGH